jgi:hypothetical protein
MPMYITIFYTSQNENVHHAYTSMHRVADLRRPDRRTAMKVLVEKTYSRRQNKVSVPFALHSERSENGEITVEKNGV